MSAHAGGGATGRGPNYGGVSHAALLAGASAFALAALGASGVAWAGCVLSLQTIATPISGPIFSNGGAIRITGSGSISGGPDGVDAFKCPITTLTNQSGATVGSGDGNAAIPGGAGVSNASTITTSTNGGKIAGGNGGSGGNTGGAGGAGASNAETITTLTNSGKIGGGNGGSGGTFGAAGGVGVSNVGTTITLTNSDAISGGTAALASPRAAWAAQASRTRRSRQSDCSSTRQPARSAGETAPMAPAKAPPAARGCRTPGRSAAAPAAETTSSRAPGAGRDTGFRRDHDAVQQRRDQRRKRRL